MFVFSKKKMYSQNDETGVLEALESKIFFAAQPLWEELYQIFSRDFTIQWWYLSEFLEKKVKNL